MSEFTYRGWIFEVTKQTDVILKKLGHVNTLVTLIMKILLLSHLYIFIAFSSAPP